jgi:tRNA 2-thiouridine synthesizing protein C
MSSEIAVKPHHNSEDKSILLIISRSAFQSPTIKEALDVALTCAAFEQAINILLTDNAPLALLPNQASNEIAQKSMNNLFSALPMYDIDTLYIDSHAKAILEPYHKSIPNILNYVNQQQIAGLIQSHDIVQRF